MTALLSLIRAFVLPQVLHPKAMGQAHHGHLSTSNMTKDIEDYVRRWDSCLRFSKCSKPTALATVADNIKECRISLDFIGPSAKLQDNILLTYIDSHFKFAFSVNSATVSNAVSALQALFGILGHPRTIVNDNGSSFVSTELDKFLHLRGTFHQISSACNTASNGVVE